MTNRYYSSRGRAYKLRVKVKRIVIEAYKVYN